MVRSHWMGPVALVLAPNESAVSATAITMATLSTIVGETQAARTAASGVRSGAGCAATRVMATAMAMAARGRARDADALCEETKARNATGHSSARPG